MTTRTTETVLGAFETRRMAERAVDDLLAAGFHAGQLSVLGRHGELTDLTPENETVDKTVAGAGIGAAIGGFGSLALGVVVAAIPGIGPVLALGPLSVALSAALGGGLVGGLVGFFAAHGESRSGRPACTRSASEPGRTSLPSTPTMDSVPRRSLPGPGPRRRSVACPQG